MDWTDTLMLEAASNNSLAESNEAMQFTQVLTLPDVTLLCANATSRSETHAALELLRGFKASGRRVVLCDTTQFAVGRQFGCEVVEQGAANLLVSCGISGREVGIGARDAGLSLSGVVVCAKPNSGGQVLAHRLSAGDVVLLLGIDEQMCEELAELLTTRFSRNQALAA